MKVNRSPAELRTSPPASSFQRRIGSLLLLALPALGLAGQEKSTFLRHEVKVGETTREYFVYSPAEPAPGPRAVVIAFHGFASDASGLRWLIKPDRTANELDLTIVYPNALKGSFNAGRGFGSRNKETDDLAFLERLLKILPERHGADPNRIFAMGFSNGAQMAILLACRQGDQLAGLGIVAHTLNITPCEISKPLPVVAIHGAKDPMVPFQGGGRYQATSHHDTIQFFRDLNKSGDQNFKVVDRATVRCRNYNKGLAEVVSCVAFDGGHSWPGGVEFKVELLGKVNRELNATEFLLSFFSKQGLRPQATEEPEALHDPEEPQIFLRRAIIPHSDGAIE